jgi:hypothetical protein
MRIKKSLVAAGLALTVTPLSVMALSNPASAYNPDGSAVEVFLENNLTADINNQITKGWWGNESGPGDQSATGGTGTDATFFSSDLTVDPNAFSDAFNGDDGSHVGIAYVVSSADGSTERPTVTAGELAGQAFGWYSDAPAYGSVQTSPQNPGVDSIWTQAGKDQWVADGKPSTHMDADLKQHLPLVAGNPLAAHQYQTSLLNTWPAGTEISVVYYLFDSINANIEPVVHVGPDGKAVTAWLKIRTVASPANPSLKTSAGYEVLTAGAAADAADDTTTTLTTSPASPQNAGASVTLSAHVANSGVHDTDNGTPTGSVEFLDGATVLDTETVDGSGNASFTTTGLSVATHSLTARFVPSGNFNTSTSAAASYVVNGIPTTVSATAVPGADVSAPVALTAVVAPTGVAGTVQFKEGGSNLGAPATVDPATGQATASYTFATPGTHNVTAVFTPTTAGYGGATSSAVSFTLAAPAGVSVDEQAIDANVPAGSIVITTPYTAANPLHVGDLALTPDQHEYTGSAQFDNIQVTDTRAGALNWTATALIGALTNGSNSINGQNVGLTGLTQDTHIGLVATTATNNAAAEPAVAPGAAGSLGLGGSTAHTVLQGKGASTDNWHGTLTINAPVDTPAGLYSGTITFTAS